MAVKKKNQKKSNKLWEIIVTEHKWENLLFVIISLATLVLGLLIFTDVLSIRPEFPVLGANPNLFTWIIIIISTAGLLYALYPFFRPVWPEFRIITWPTRVTFLGNSIRVFSFLIFLALVFLGYDIIIREVLSWIIG